MMTVPEAARRVGRDAETVRRWIRSGKLRTQKVGTQYLIEERDLDRLMEPDGAVGVPAAWRRTWTGEPQPDWVQLIRRSRRGH